MLEIDLMYILKGGASDGRVTSIGGKTHRFQQKCQFLKHTHSNFTSWRRGTYHGSCVGNSNCEKAGTSLSRPVSRGLQYLPMLQEPDVTSKYVQVHELLPMDRDLDLHRQVAVMNFDGWMDGKGMCFPFAWRVPVTSSQWSAVSVTSLVPLQNSLYDPAIHKHGFSNK